MPSGEPPFKIAQSAASSSSSSSSTLTFSSPSRQPPNRRQSLAPLHAAHSRLSVPFSRAPARSQPARLLVVAVLHLIPHPGPVSPHEKPTAADDALAPNGQTVTTTTTRLKRALELFIKPVPSDIRASAFPGLSFCRPTKAAPKLPSLATQSETDIICRLAGWLVTRDRWLATARPPSSARFHHRNEVRQLADAATAASIAATPIGTSTVDKCRLGSGHPAVGLRLSHALSVGLQGVPSQEAKGRLSGTCIPRRCSPPPVDRLTACLRPHCWLDRAAETQQPAWERLSPKLQQSAPVAVKACSCMCPSQRVPFRLSFPGAARPEPGRRLAWHPRHARLTDRWPSAVLLDAALHQLRPSIPATIVRVWG